MPDKPHPAWTQTVKRWLAQTSTRSGLLFAALATGGVTLTDQEATVIMAGAGFLAAVFGLIWPDKPR